MLRKPFYTWGGSAGYCSLVYHVANLQSPLGTIKRDKLAEKKVLFAINAKILKEFGQLDTIFYEDL